MSGAAVAAKAAVAVAVAAKAAVVANAARSEGATPPGDSRGIGSSTEMLAPEKENNCCEHSGNRWVDGGMSDGEMSDDERSDCERSEGERSDCTHRGQTYFPHGHVFTTD